MKSYFSKSSHIANDDNSILTDLAKTRYALETAYAGFDNATDPDLIDCYIYELNAVQKRYKYLLGQAAAMNADTQKSSPQEALNEKPSVSLMRHALCKLPFSIG